MPIRLILPRLTLVAGLAGLAVAPAAAQLGAGIGPGAKLKLTTTVAAAEAEYLAGLSDITNVFAARGATRLKRALELDPRLGLARVIYATSAAGLPRTEREAEIERGVADAARGSAVEGLFALAWRETFTGNGARAFDLLNAAAELVPGDADVGYYRALASINVPGNTVVDQVRAFRTFIRSFPDYAPARNILAYRLWATGDRAGAFAEVQEYLRLVPSHPNAHDSFAELLQWDGRFEEAIAHYRRAAELDAGFINATIGVAEVQTLMGRGDDARKTLETVGAAATTPAARANNFRRIALTFVREGNIKQAGAALSQAAGAVQGADLPALETQIHTDMAMIDLFLGDGKTVAAHAAAALAGTPDEPTRRIWTAMQALAGNDVAGARTVTEQHIAASSGALDEAQARNARTTLGYILVLDGKPAEAITSVHRGNAFTPFGRAVVALAEQARGNAASARAIRDELAGRRQINLLAIDDGVALQLVRRIK